MNEEDRPTFVRAEQHSVEALVVVPCSHVEHPDKRSSHGTDVGSRPEGCHFHV